MCNLSECIEENAILSAKEEVAVKMIKASMSDEIIHEMTELSLDKIAELREQEMCLV